MDKYKSLPTWQSQSRYASTYPTISYKPYRNKSCATRYRRLLCFSVSSWLFLRAIRLLQSFQFQVNNTQGEIVGITDIVDGGLAQIAGLQVVIADGFSIVCFTLDDETFIPPATGILTSFVVGEELIGEQLCISNAEFLEYPSGLLVPVTVPTCAELAYVYSFSLSLV